MVNSGQFYQAWETLGNLPSLASLGNLGNFTKADFPSLGKFTKPGKLGQFYQAWENLPSLGKFTKPRKFTMQPG